MIDIEKLPSFDSVNGEIHCFVNIAEEKIKELETIKAEIKDLDLEFFDEDYRAGVARGIMEFNKILNKHIAELKGDDKQLN